MKTEKRYSSGERVLDLLIRDAREGSPLPDPGFEQRVMRRIRTESSASDKLSRRMHFRFVLAPLAAGLAFFIALAVFRTPAGKSALQAVEFRAAFPGARSVALVGDFNKWQRGADRMIRRNGGWHISKRLGRGRYYKYAFLVDGRRIVADHNAGQTVADGFGGTASVIFVN